MGISIFVFSIIFRTHTKIRLRAWGWKEKQNQAAGTHINT